MVESLQVICGTILDRYMIDGKLKEICDEKSNIFNYNIINSKTVVNTKKMGLYDKHIVIDIIKNRILHYINDLKSTVFDTDNNCLVYGDIQSGKTKLIIACCWWFQYIEKKTNFLLLRNITQDYYQFSQRVKEFNRKYIQNKKYYVKEVYIKNIDELPSKNITVVCLMNVSQINKLVGLVYKHKNTCSGTFTKNNDYVRVTRSMDREGYIYVNNKCYSYTSVGNNMIKLNNTNTNKRNGKYEIYEIEYEPEIEYILQIDEVDISKKSENMSYRMDYNMKKLKNISSFMVGYSATPLCSMLFDNFKRTVRLEIPDDYVGINDIKIIEETDLDKIYKKFMSKSDGIMLHNTSKFKSDHHFIAKYLKRKFNNLVTVVQNGTGLYVYDKSEYKIRNISNNKITKKNYKKSKFVHHFKNVSINVLIQILKDNNVKHISIISRIIASRGMSYVSYDYKWHITDQILNHFNNTSDCLIQSIRCCGVWYNNKNVNLWTTKEIKNEINEYYKFVNTCVKIVGNEVCNPSMKTVLCDKKFDKTIDNLFSKSKFYYKWIENEDGTYSIDTRF
jgi:hypothetical protein